MLFDSFCKKTENIWNSYLSVLRGTRLEYSGIPLFANTAIFTKFDGYFCFELYGLSRQMPRRINVIRQKGKNIYDLFNLFDIEVSAPLFRVGKGVFSLSKLCIANEGNSDLVAKRFPIDKMYETTLIRKNGSGSIIKFEDDFRFCALDRILITNFKHNLCRSRNINFLCIFKNDIITGDLEKFFDIVLFGEGGLREVYGAVCCGSESDEYIYAVSELQNAIVTRSVRETTIGHILNTHVDVLKCALQSDDIVYEPYLRWVEYDEDPGQQAINPDFLLKNKEGSYDILDLKLARFDKIKMYKGDIPRRRFVDYINEGIHQLYNYRRYFDFQKNRDYAYERYGVKVADPKLILVVGNLENLPQDEVARAILPYKDLEVIDYDTLVSLFLSNAVSRSSVSEE